MDEPTEAQGVQQLELYRPYLALLASLPLGAHQRSKLHPSDVVQVALMRAHEHQPAFRGTTEAERRAWLRRILVYALAEAARRFGAGNRDVARELPLAARMTESSARLEALVAAE